MIDKISYELVNYLASKVEFIDKWAGLVKPMHKKVQTEDKVFPVAINTPVNCNQSDYMALVPDSSKSSIVYVEKQGDLTVISSTSNYEQINTTLQLVVWYNLDRITEGDYISEDVLVDRILDWLPKRLADNLFVGCKQVHFEPINILYGTDIVSKYTYNEIKTQFGIHPYGIFAIDIDCWYVATHCSKAITPIVGCMSGKGNHETPDIDEEIQLTIDTDMVTIDSTEIKIDQTKY
jgi:hypothetical protein